MTPTTVAGVPVADEVVARFLRDLSEAGSLRLELPGICERHGFELRAGQILANRSGYPDRRHLARAAEQAENRALAHNGRATAADPPVPGSQAHPDAAGATQGDSGEGRVLKVPLRLIRADEHNVRGSLTELDDLAESMSGSLGLLQPIVLRQTSGDPPFAIVAGHRRRAAALRLKWEAIDAIVRGPMIRADVLAAMLIENGQRVGLNPIEEARALASLLEQRSPCTHKELARLVGRSQPFVSSRLALLDLSTEDQEAIAAGTMSLVAGTKRGRVNGGYHRPGAAGKASAAHFSEHHPLARAVEAACRAQGHSKHTAGYIGGVGCGRCWEAVIRSDEEAKLRRRSKVEAASDA